MAVKVNPVLVVYVVLLSGTGLLKTGQAKDDLNPHSRWKKSKQITVPLFDENDVYDYTMSLVRQLGWTQVVLLTNQELAMTRAVVKLDGALTAQQHVLSCSPAGPGGHGSVLQVDTALLNTLVKLADPSIVIVGTDCLQLQVMNWLTQDLPDVVGHMSPLVQESHWLLVLNSHVIEMVNMTSLLVNHMAVLQHDLKSRLGALKTLTWTSSGRHLGAVRTTQGSRVQQSRVYPNQQHGCNGMALRVAINTWRPYIMEEVQGGRTVYQGFSMDLLAVLSTALNFTYTVTIPEDGEWGDYRDGRWTGVVGQIDRQEVDFSVAPLTPKLERWPVVDWTGPMNIRYTGIAVRIMSHNAQLVMALFRPFRWQVYTYVLAAFVFVAIVIRVGIRLESTLRNQPHHKDPSVSLIIEFLFGSFLKEIIPSSLLNRGGFRRPLIAAWSTFGLLVTTCYTSKLTSLLVDFTAPPPFNSLQEMVSSGEYRWGMIGGTALVHTFRNSNNSVMKAAYQGVMNFANDDPDVLNLDAEVHRAKMASQAYAFIGEEDLLDLWAAEDCFIRVIRERIVGMETYNVFTPKRSVLTQRIDAVLLKLEAGGVMDQLKAKWWPKESPCVRKDSSQSAITLATMQGAFYMAAGGTVLATGALMWERVAGKAFRRCGQMARKLWLPFALGGRDRKL